MLTLFPIVLAGVLHLLLAAGDDLDHVSFDSFRYLAGAESIRSSGTYLDPSGKPQQTWPPGTSLLYAAVSSAVHRPPEILVFGIDLAAYLVAVLAFAAFLWRSGVTVIPVAVTLLAFALNGAFLGIASKLWSDPLALALLVAFLTLTLLSLTAQRNRVALAWVALALLAMALTIRYAMAGAVPTACMLFFMTWRGARRWLAAAAVPFAALTLLLLEFRLLGVPAARSARRFTLAPIPFREDVRAFGDLANQLLPVRLFGPATPWVVLLLFIVVPLATVAVSLRRGSSMRDLRAQPLVLGALVAESCVVGYVALLPVMQSVAFPSFRIDLRILLPLLPGMLAATACAAQWAFRQEARRPWWTAITVILFASLAVAGARSLKFWSTGSMFDRDTPISTPRCYGRDQLIADLRSIVPLVPADASIVTNVQGPAWYVFRRPIEPLEVRTLDVLRRPGAFLIYVTASGSCEGIPEIDSVPLRDAVIPGGRMVARHGSLTLISAEHVTAER